MKSFLRISVAVLAFNGGIAAAQTATETTTTQYTAPVAPSPAAVPLQPQAGTLSSTRTTRAVDAYGNQVEQQQTTYRNDAGVAQDSRTTTTIVPMSPPPPVTTTTTTESTTTAPR